MAKCLTVGELKKVIKGVEDWVPIKIISDTELGHNASEITLEDAWSKPNYTRGCMELVLYLNQT